MSQTMSRRRALKGLGMLGLGGVARSVGAQDPVNPPPSCPVLEPPLPGTVGLLRGQFARLAVVHYELGGSVDPELIVAEIIGGDGKALASASFSQLGPNEARFLDFVHPATKGKLAGTRIELFGLVRYTPGHRVGGSLQIVDSSSGLTLWPTDPEIFQDPTLGGQGGNLLPAEYPLPGTVGFVRGQLLRISMVRHERNPVLWPTDPEVIVADVLDGKGNLLASEKFSNLNPHQAVFLDFPHPGGKGPARDTRLEVSVNVRFTPGHHIGGTVSVIDASSGQTGAAVHPCLLEDPTLQA